MKYSILPELFQFLKRWDTFFRITFKIQVKISPLRLNFS